MGLHGNTWAGMVRSLNTKMHVQHGVIRRLFSKLSYQIEEDMGEDSYWGQAPAWHGFILFLEGI